MKRYALAMLCAITMPLLRAQNAKEAQSIMDKEFPIVFEVEKSEIVRPVTDERRLSQASVMGSAPPTFGVFRGTLNQERHWLFSCWAENARLEVIQCTDMPIGLHRARWVHNRELLEVFAYDNGGNVSLRYVDVAVDSKNPPPMGDTVQSLPTSPGLFTFENKGKDYPLLVHVYGTVAMSFQVGQFPARTNCDITNPFPDRVNVSCTQYPPDSGQPRICCRRSIHRRRQRTQHLL